MIYLKRFQILIIAMLLTTAITFPAWGDNEKATIHFKNITIDTMGNQSYDTKTNMLINAGHTRMTIDDIVIEADDLRYSVKENLAVFTGNVLMLRDVVSIRANRLAFNLNSSWLEASGAVRMDSPAQSFSMETIRYNINQEVGKAGPVIHGVVKGSEKDFYVTGKEADLSGGTIIISPAGLTRCPRKDFADYIFDAKKMVIKGNHVYMEKVLFKILGIPLLYLPRLALRGEEVPHISLSANQGNQPDLSQLINESKGSAKPAEKSNTVHNSPNTEGAVNPNEPEAPTKPAVKSDTVRSSPNTEGAVNPNESATPTRPAVKSNTVRSSPNITGEINTNDKPSRITFGRIYEWSRYSQEIDLNFDSEGIFSLTDIFQIDWGQYDLTIDGKLDLFSKPKRELGIAFTKKAWATSFGNWQVSLFSRLLYEDQPERNYRGVYGGYRVDYQLTSDLNCSYLYLDGLSGTETDWERLESDFLEINDYRLGGNFIYSLNIPLNPHYYIFNKGGYNFRDGEWVSQITGLAREVDCIKIGLGWDFAKEFIELQFRLKY